MKGKGHRRGQHSPQLSRRAIGGTILGCFLLLCLYRSTSMHRELWKRWTEIEDDSGPILRKSVHGDGSAFCLLIKDDNDILPEWIAYHYHVFRMRRLIVALDPDSKTSPLEILQSWTKASAKYPSLDPLKFDVWTDTDYTPSFFHGSTRDTSQIPNSVRKEITYDTANDVIIDHSRASVIDKFPIRKTIWHRNETYARLHQEEVRRDVHQINNHRFRQKNFVSECFRAIKKEQEAADAEPAGLKKRRKRILWTVHVDTDEYLVPNPWILPEVRHNHNSKNLVPFETSAETTSTLPNFFERVGSIYPVKASYGSLWEFFKSYSDIVFPTLRTTQKLPYGAKSKARHKGRACLMMPRILFGAKENENSKDRATNIAQVFENPTNKTRSFQVQFEHEQFETLRWKYHSNFNSTARPKSMINVNKLSLEKDEIFSSKLSVSIHRPIGVHLWDKKTLACMKEPLMIPNVHRYAEPLAVYHYLGSLDRYLSRGDVRRDPKVHKRYNAGAIYAKGDSNVAHDDESNNETTTEEDSWISGWLADFVRRHGTDVTSMVLGSTYEFKFVGPYEFAEEGGISNATL